MPVYRSKRGPKYCKPAASGVCRFCGQGDRKNYELCTAYTVGPTKPKNVKGLGDVVANVFKALRIDRLFKKAVPKCGCDKRQEKLNRWFPFRWGKS